ncbi:glycosyltransferase involved in cell wall biosynthesis [Catenuloplanes nepalensis]|uniref:Glycosyltransferase involved in cell wall biosynthesis n=1 Tax=Catenuloplanes nepalensis TaxID=587533 RepID=A0ABT9MY46_9ACTN|nr:glycosyltransferase [Catenuloplanes nepalensis]MDP9796361.1 glycosyltransferase involved in cell wall biosynthesis [Catenuloplanes nepalensis]
MRIAMVAAGTAAGELAAALGRLGHDVREYDAAGKPAGERLGAAWSDDDWGPEVIHAHGWAAGVAALASGAAPLVQAFHGLSGPAPANGAGPDERRTYERLLCRVADRIIAGSTDECGELLRLGVPRGRITLVPPGVDCELFTPVGDPMPRMRPRVLAVADGATWAGDLVRAMRMVPDAEAVVLGGPPELAGLAERCRVADRVVLHRAVPRDERPAWFRSADVAVCAPWRDPSGSAPIEAMACGVPVVGTATGLVRDAVIDGLTGELVPPRDPRALGMAIRALLADNLRRFTAATAALDRARQVYPWPRIADRTAVVCLAACGQALPVAAEELSVRS